MRNRKKHTHNNNKNKTMIDTHMQRGWEQTLQKLSTHLCRRVSICVYGYEYASIYRDHTE